MEREICEAFRDHDEEGSPEIEKDSNDNKEGETEGSPSLGSLMPTIEVHKTPVLDMNTRQRPEIPGGEKFSLMLRKNTANHLRKREEHLLEARRCKEERTCPRVISMISSLTGTMEMMPFRMMLPVW